MICFVFTCIHFCSCDATVEQTAPQTIMIRTCPARTSVLSRNLCRLGSRAFRRNNTLPVLTECIAAACSAVCTLLPGPGWMNGLTGRTRSKSSAQSPGRKLHAPADCLSHNSRRVVTPRKLCVISQRYLFQNKRNRAARVLNISTQ